MIFNIFNEVGELFQLFDEVVGMLFEFVVLLVGSQQDGVYACFFGTEQVEEVIADH